MPVNKHHKGVCCNIHVHTHLPIKRKRFQHLPKACKYHCSVQSESTASKRHEFITTKRGCTDTRCGEAFIDTKNALQNVSVVHL